MPVYTCRKPPLFLYIYISKFNVSSSSQVNILIEKAGDSDVGKLGLGPMFVGKKTKITPFVGGQAGQ
jgi:hypothetical protein